MLSKRKLVLLISVSALSLSIGAYANLPVIDPTNIAENIKEVTQLKHQYDTMQNQYSQMKQQYSSITGNYGWGNWQNGSSDLSQREWAPGDWHSALQGMSGGNPGRYQELLSQYKQSHQTMSKDQFAKGSDQNLATSYKNQVQTNQASSVSATYEFNDINKHLQNLQQLGKQIETAKNLKSAMDLNSRVQLEVAYISIEELRMQTVLNQQMAQSEASKITQENEAAQFNQAGENPQ